MGKKIFWSFEDFSMKAFQIYWSIAFHLITAWAQPVFSTECVYLPIKPKRKILNSLPALLKSAHCCTDHTKIFNVKWTVYLKSPSGSITIIKMAQSLQESLSTLWQCKSASNKALTNFRLIWQVMEVYYFPWETFSQPNKSQYLSSYSPFIFKFQERSLERIVKWGVFWI